MEMHETFNDKDEAMECMAKHPGAEMTFREGHPIMLFGELTYAIPEDKPQWTVWWEEPECQEREKGDCAGFGGVRRKPDRRK